MASSGSPLIHDVEQSYGSVACGTSQSSIEEVTDECRPVHPAPSALGFVAKNAGMLLIIASQFFFACMNVSVKVLNRLDPPVHALQVVLVRMGVTFLGCVIYMFIKRIPNPIIGPKGVRTLLVVRGITGFVGICGLYWSLQYLSVADTTVITFLLPLTTSLAGCVFLKEGYSAKQVLAAVCSLLGVVLIARPSFLFGSLSADPVGPVERLMGVGGALINVLGATGAYTSIRAIGKRVHPMQILVHFSLWSIIMAPIGMAIFDIPFVYPSPRSWMWTLLLMVGVLSFIAQALLTMGLQRETMSRGTNGLYVRVIFVVMLEVLLFGVLPSLLSVLGAAIIISSAIYVALAKQKPS